MWKTIDSLKKRFIRSANIPAWSLL